MPQCTFPLLVVLLVLVAPSYGNTCATAEFHSGAFTSSVVDLRFDPGIIETSPCDILPKRGFYYAVENFSGVGRNFRATTCRSATDFDTVIYVFDQCGDIFCERDDDGGCGLTSSIDFFVPTGDTKYIFVTSFGSTGGEFQLRVSEGGAVDVGAIIGGVIGGLVFLGCVTALILVCVSVAKMGNKPTTTVVTTSAASPYAPATPTSAPVVPLTTVQGPRPVSSYVPPPAAAAHVAPRPASSYVPQPYAPSPYAPPPSPYAPPPSPYAPHAPPPNPYAPPSNASAPPTYDQLFAKAVAQEEEKK